MFMFINKKNEGEILLVFTLMNIETFFKVFSSLKGDKKKGKKEKKMF